MRTAMPLLIAAAALICLSEARGADPAPPAASQPAAPTKEMREKMASLHEQMAACLRSDKSITECRQTLMRSCRDSLGPHDCPMMGMGMMGMGMGPGRGRETPPPKADSHQ